jgi:AcrR family transcriptional regulator
MTLYRHFPSKKDSALAFLDLREERWTIEWLKAEIERRAHTPRERLLAVFDLYHEWFQQPDFEGCSFIKVMLESEPGSPLHEAACAQLNKLGDYVTDLALAADVTDPASLSSTWQMLMKGAIVSACAGNINAAAEAKAAASVFLKALSKSVI